MKKECYTQVQKRKTIRVKMNSGLCLKYRRKKGKQMYKPEGTTKTAVKNQQRGCETKRTQEREMLKPVAE